MAFAMVFATAFTFRTAIHHGEWNYDCHPMISVYHCNCALWPQIIAIPVVIAIAECNCELCCDVFAPVFGMAFHHGECSCYFKRTCLRDIAFTIMNELVACHHAWRSQSRSRSRQSRMPSRNTITMLWLVVTIAIVCTTISNAGTEGKYTGARDGIWFGHSPCQRQPRSPSQLHSCHIYVIDDYFVLCDQWFEITTLLVLWSAKRYWFLCGLFETDNLQLPVQPWSRKVSRREDFLKLGVQHMTGFLFRREDLGPFAKYTSELRWLRSNP